MQGKRTILFFMTGAFVCLLIFVGVWQVHAQVNVNLMVEGCNDNNVCEPDLGESVSSCAADCTGFACGDGVDNDGDGDIDHPNDLQCQSKSDDSEVATVACSDGGDNDGDGLVDHPNDPGCDSAGDDSEDSEGSGGGSSGGGGAGSGDGDGDTDDGDDTGDGDDSDIPDDDGDDDADDPGDDDAPVDEDEPADEEEDEPADEPADDADTDDTDGTSGGIFGTDEAVSFSPGELPVLSQLEDVTAGARDFLENQTNRALAQAVALATLLVGVLNMIVSTVFVNPLAISDLALLPMRIWSLLLSAFGFRNKRRPWGTVYDSVTKQPLDPAYVVLRDADGEEVSTSITDMDGRYGFLPAPGTYWIVAHKTHYRFPSERLSGQRADELYTDLYFGGEVVIDADRPVISKNIPMDPEDFDWNEFAKRQQKLMKYYSKRDVIFSKVVNLLFLAGAMISMAVTVLFPTVYNIIILALYVVMAILRETPILKPKEYGHVVYADSGVPVSFAIVRIFSAQSDREVKHVVADKKGKYFCLVGDGDYYVTIEEKRGDEAYVKIYTSEVFSVSGGVVTERFEV